MPDSIRVFIAVPIPATPALRQILARLGLLGGAVKPVDVDNLHVTLKFLGQTPIDQIPKIVNVMRNAADGETAFTAEIIGLGAFPRPERPSVVWAGLHEADGLSRMAERLEQRLAPLGFPSERRPFHPHLTLARVRRKPPADLADLLRNRRVTEFGSTDIETIQLFQSEPGPSGPRYRSLSTVGLASSTNC